MPPKKRKEAQRSVQRKVPHDPLSVALDFAGPPIATLTALCMDSSEEVFANAVAVAHFLWEEGPLREHRWDLRQGIPKLLSLSVAYDPHRCVWLNPDATDASLVRATKGLAAHNISLRGCRELGGEFAEALRPLSRSLEVLDITGTLLTDGMLEGLHTLRALRELKASHCAGLTSSFARTLTRMPSLVSVDVGGANVQSDFVAQISKKKILEEVYLDGCSQLTDSIGPYMKKLAHLRVLRLDGCDQLTDSVVSSIASITTLRRLSLRSCSQMTDAIGAHLRQLKYLTALNLSQCTRLTDGITTDLRELLEIREVDLSATRVVNVEPLARAWKHLVRMHLFECKCLTSETHTAVAHFTQKLQCLNVGGCRISDDFVANLTGLTQLRDLTLRFCHMSQHVGQHLRFMPSLSHVDLHSCLEVTDATIEQLSHCTGLVTLRIGNCKNVTDAAGPSLALLEHLETLELCGCELLTDGMGLHVGNLASLVNLDVSRCTLLTDLFAERISTLTLLRQLRISWCEHFTIYCAPHLGKLPHLNFIDCGGSSLSSVVKAHFRKEVVLWGIKTAPSTAFSYAAKRRGQLRRLPRFLH